MSDPIESMAGEMIYHRTREGGICSCGRLFRPGENIMRHRANAVFIAMTLNQVGVQQEKLHQAVLEMLRLIDGEKRWYEN